MIAILRYCTVGLFPLSLLAGCRQSKDASNGVRDVFADSTNYLANIVGGDTSKGSEGTIGVVVASRVIWSRHLIVVLDATEPFIKIYDWKGALIHAFVKKGGGPTELGVPVTMAVLDDSLVLISDIAGKMEVFGLDGSERASASFPPLRPLAALGGCRGKWILYGPLVTGGTRPKGVPDQASWLHIAPALLTSTPEADLIETLVPSEPLSYGKAYGIARKADTVYIRHDMGPNPRIIRWPCDINSGTTVATLSRKRDTGGGSGKDITFSLTAQTRVPVGLAALPHGVLTADVNPLRGEDAQGTWFTGFYGPSKVEARMPGAYVIRDSRSDVGVLLETDDPVPHLFIVPAGPLDSAISFSAK